MPFDAQAVTSTGAIFATELRNSDSVHFPLSKIVWGADSGTFNPTDTSTPFPVSVISAQNNSADPVFVANNSANPVFVRGMTNSNVAVTVSNPTDTTVTVTGYTAPSTTVTVTNIASNDTVVTVTGYVAPSTTVTVTNIASNDTVVTVTGYTAPSTTVTVSNIAANDTTVTAILNGGESSVTVASGNITVTNDSTDLLYVSDSATPVFVRGLTDSVVPTYSQATGNSVGSLQSFTTVLSSAIESITSSGARIYGWHMFNPSTDGDVYVKMFADDSTGVTKGTTAATLNLALPFGGGNNVDIAAGIRMSSGISLLAAGGTAATDTSAPSTSAVVTIWYRDLSGG